MKHYDIAVCCGGVAAALACDRHADPAEIPAADLQRELRKTGGIIHIAEGRDFRAPGF